MITPRISALAVAAVFGLSPLAHAQTPPQPPPHPAMGGHWEGGPMRERMKARAGALVHALHDILAIRPDQEDAFQAFVASMRPAGPDGMDGGREPGVDSDNPAAATSMTAPERADRMLKRFDERTGRMREALERRAAAVKTFYAVLTPEQQRSFDALAGLLGHHAMGMRPGGAPGWRPHGEMGMDGPGPRG
jgi:Spy/CpxP family protein refolding chaperone